MDADVIEEGKKLVELAEGRGVALRLFGGLGIRLHCPKACLRDALKRSYPDIDLFGVSKQSRDISKLFIESGYVPRDMFNRLHGNTRLIFNDFNKMRRADIFLDYFRMCHKFDFRNRIKLDYPSLTPSDLLITKLQIVELNERDYKDIISLVLDHKIGEADEPETINASYLARLCTDDWGIYKTFTVSLGNVLEKLPAYGLDQGEASEASDKIKQLAQAIEKAPKSLRWKMRAKLGERRPWYELPEKDKPIVDSRSITERSTPPPQ